MIVINVIKLMLCICKNAVAYNIIIIVVIKFLNFETIMFELSELLN